jgi:hypothetical protein
VNDPGAAWSAAIGTIPDVCGKTPARRLIQRTTRKLRITEGSEKYFRYCEAVIREVELLRGLTYAAAMA